MALCQEERETHSNLRKEESYVLKKRIEQKQNLGRVKNIKQNRWRKKMADHENRAGVSMKVDNSWHKQENA